nr:hypothetical protein CFP56_44509 [Quercus suber]
MIKHILREMEQNKLDSGSGNFSSDSGNEARAGVGSEDGLGSKDEQGSGAGGASSENGLGSGTGASSENGIRSKDGSEIGLDCLHIMIKIHFSDFPTQVRLINQSGTKICDFVKCLPTPQVHLAHNSFHNKVLFDELNGSLNVTSIYSLVDNNCIWTPLLGQLSLKDASATVVGLEHHFWQALVEALVKAKELTSQNIIGLTDSRNMEQVLYNRRKPQ